MTKEASLALRNFPWKLHLLLAQAEERGQSSIISWLPDGRSFIVRDKEKFACEIMPDFFNTSTFKSFQRNLNLWGFLYLSKGIYSHHCFVKGLPNLCNSMSRKVKKRKQEMGVIESEQNPNSLRAPAASLPQVQTRPSVLEGLLPSHQGLATRAAMFLPTLTPAPTVPSISSEEARLRQAANASGMNLLIQKSNVNNSSHLTTNGPESPFQPSSEQKSVVAEQKADSAFLRWQEVARKGSTTIPCRARGMPLDHNCHNAFFEITSDVKHGARLPCSHSVCRNGGIKFLYCADCKLPASKRTFWSLHNHEQHKKEDVSTKSSETETLAAKMSLSRIAFEAASRFVAQKEEKDAKKRTAIVDVEECKESSSSSTTSSGGSHAASSTNVIW